LWQILYPGVPAEGSAPTAPVIRRTIRPRRLPRPGRLKGKDLKALRLACFERDRGLCITFGQPTLFGAPHEWPNSFHMAHRRGKRMWGDHLGQVDTQCGACHRESHSPKVVSAK